MRNWDRYFIELCHSVAKQNQSCIKRQVGALLVRSDNSIIATGYNGAPRGVLSCGSLMTCRRDGASKLSPDRYDHCIAVHAEQNCLAFAAKHGVKVEGAKAYITHKPCIHCLRLLIQAGVSEVVYDEELSYYDGNETYKELIDKIKMRKYLLTS